MFHVVAYDVLISQDWTDEEVVSTDFVTCKVLYKKTGRVGEFLKFHRLPPIPVFE